MGSPFPGMDPYLEEAVLWPDVHNSLITALRNVLAPQLRPDYYLAIEERIYITEPEPVDFVGRGDVVVVQSPQTSFLPTASSATSTLVTPQQIVMVELPMPDRTRETYLEVRQADHTVITVIEILTHTNKRTGSGRNLYLQKRDEILNSQTHLVEIDLLRGWPPMPMSVVEAVSDYRILLSRAEERPRASLYPFGIRQTIPTFPLPLAHNYPEPTINLNFLLHTLYQQASYDLRINYNTQPTPSLSMTDQQWVEEILQEAGLRT